MKRRHLILGALVVAVVVGFVKGGCSASRTAEDVEIVKGGFEVGASFDATLEAKNVETVMSRFQGKATLVYLAPEGGAVTQGQVLVRFDDSDIQAALLTQHQTLARVAAELDALEMGEIPLELKEIELQLAEAELQCSMESRILEDTRLLVEKNLVSGHEVEQEESKLGSLTARLSQLQQRRVLLVEHIHPARLTQARSDVEAAQKQVDQLERQQENCTVVAPASGMVVYLPIHFANEYRNARIGDSMYPNQPFMCLPDMSEFLAVCYVPEADLARVRHDGEAVIVPLAYPECRLKGRVDGVGLMAQNQPGFPVWQKYVRVVFRLEDVDPRLRPGMSVRVDSISRRADDVTLIPRVAVRWERGEAFVMKKGWRRGIITPIRVGEGNERYFEVLEGVEPGDRVILP